MSHQNIARHLVSLSSSSSPVSVLLLQAFTQAPIYAGKVATRNKYRPTLISATWTGPTHRYTMASFLTCCRQRMVSAAFRSSHLALQEKECSVAMRSAPPCVIGEVVFRIAIVSFRVIMYPTPAILEASLHRPTYSRAPKASNLKELDRQQCGQFHHARLSQR